MPEWKSEIIRRLASLNLAPAREAEIADELAEHLEDRYQELLSHGETSEFAERAALDELRGEDLLAHSLSPVETSVHREPIAPGRATGNFFSGILQDLRYASRILRKSPGFTIAAVLTLALGIGATTAMFCVVDAVLLRPLPYQQSGRLVSFFSINAGFVRNLPAPGDYTYWRSEKELFEGVAADDSRSYTLTGDAVEPEQLEVEAVSPELFPLLGVTPLLGRVFGPAEDKPGSDRVILISYRLWRDRFGGDRSLVGQNILMNGERYTVDGVMRPDFSFPFASSEAWIPIDLTPQQLADRGDHYLNEVVGRLKPGVTVQKANAALLLLSQQLAREYPTSSGESIERSFVEPLRATYTRDARGELLLLMAAVTFILLIACANVASLLLSRMEQRQHEIAMRAALGASRARIFGQLLTESALLATGGGALGILLAESALGFLKALIPGDLVHSVPLTLDFGVLAFLVAVLFVSTLLFGSAPAMRALRFDVNETLKQGRTRTSSMRLGEAFVVTEIALSITLVIGGGLLLESFWKLQFLDPGFRSENVMTLSLVTPTMQRFVDFDRRAELFDRILERVKTLAGVKDAAFTSAVPLIGTGGGMIGTMPFTPEGVALEDGVDRAQDRVITPGYFEALRIPLHRGRFFDEKDGPNAPLVAIVNETMARTYWPNQDAIDKQFKFGDATAPTPWIRIVGVVGDVRQMALDQPPWPEMYFPYRQARGNYMVMQDLVVRTSGTVTGLGDALRHLVWSIDPGQPVSNVISMSDRVNHDIAPRRIRACLLGGLASIALALACVGIYGVMSHVVARRTREIGIRAALGATPRDIARSILGRGARLTSLGVGIGLAAAAASGQLIAGLLFGVRPTDPLTFAVAAFLLAAVALLACYIPARRAMQVDPMVALRHE
jgi:putative ABC transport system permease protein